MFRSTFVALTGPAVIALFQRRWTAGSRAGQRPGVDRKVLMPMAMASWTCENWSGHWPEPGTPKQSFVRVTPRCDRNPPGPGNRDCVAFDPTDGAANRGFDRGDSRGGQDLLPRAEPAVPRVRRRVVRIDRSGRHANPARWTSDGSSRSAACNGASSRCSICLSSWTKSITRSKHLVHADMSPQEFAQQHGRAWREFLADSAFA